MKKIIVGICMLFLLGSCFETNSKEDVENAKKELLGHTTHTQSGTVDDTKTTPSKGVSGENESDDSHSKEETHAQKETFSTRYLTDEEFIKFDTMNEADFLDMQEEIKGITLVHVDKITVLYTNPTSSFPDGIPYTLRQFKPGDSTFLFRAFKAYKTLDYGENTYIFTAYSGQKKSELELKVYIPRPSENLQPVDIGNLPENPTFGNPIQLGSGKVGYSDIKGLEITQVGDIDLINEPDSITEYLKKHINGYFYWNTARYTNGKMGVSFYVVSQKKPGEEYIYEKHYYNGNGLYGILPLTTGSMSEGDTLQQKNIELKETNDTYTLVKVANVLFQQITR